MQSQYQVSATNANQQSLQAIEARQEAANSESELSQREDELAALDRRTRSLAGRLAAARRSHRVSEARLQEAQAALDGFSRMRQQTGASSSQAAINALKVRQQKVLEIYSKI